ncbi:MAG: nucleoside-diphosphate kinase [Nanoarchaeota archaeon]
MIEQTLVLIKPDGIQQKLIGKIITRFEDAGLKIVAVKMIWPDEKKAKEHYPLDEEWARNVFDKSKNSAEKNKEKFIFKNHLDFGKFIQDGLVDFIQESPIVALVLEAPHAIDIVRKMIGATEPRAAIPGTIRSDFASVESYPNANIKKRAVRNLVHASDSFENAKKEIKVWFNNEEVHDYKRPIDENIF